MHPAVGRHACEACFASLRHAHAQLRVLGSLQSCVWYILFEDRLLSNDLGSFCHQPWMPGVGPN